LSQGQEKVMALCDEEEEYAQLMTEFLRKHRDLPWKLRTYTSSRELLGRETEVEMLVVAESSYCEEMNRLCAGPVVVLNESGILRWENVRCVDKYCCAEEVLKELLAIYAETANTQLPRFVTGHRTKFIGNYSPVRRGLQTSFALTLGQLLAEKHKTLYLNFEHYAGVEGLLPDMQILDMADLLYFLNAEQDKFGIRMQTMIRHIGALDYIPPMKVGQNLLTVTEEEWLALLRKTEELCEYEYVILDLSESMQGLFEILRFCSTVFTSVSKDRIGERKLMQYEQVLALYEYEDVLKKTTRLDLSHIRRLPPEPEMLTKGELAKVAEKWMESL